MALAPYTTNDNVRGVLGISDEELTDSVLSLSIYELNLLAALKRVGATILTDFGTVTNITESSRTTVQANFYNALVLYSPYAVAIQLGSSLPLIAPKLVSDGKAQVSRFSESPFEAMLARLKADHDRLFNELVDAYAGYTGGSVTNLATPILFVIGDSSIDRVTNTARV